MGNVTLYRNDESGHISEIVDPKGSMHQLQYDELLRLCTVIDAVEHRTRYECNVRVLPTRRLDALCHSGEYVYDRAQRLVKPVNENSEAYRFGHDRNDNLFE